MDSLAQMPSYEAYKNSRVTWLESTPSHWEEFPLVAKATLKSISNCINEELLSVYLDRGVIRFEDAEQKRTNVTSLDLSKYQLVEIGDLVLNNQQAWRGSVGVSAYRGIVSPAYLVLSLSKDLIPNYANYLFRDGSMVSYYLICSKGVGTIQRNLYWPQLKRIPIYLPPIAEQCKIADFLDEKTVQIEEAIAIKAQQIELLQERKQIIIQQAVTRGLDPDMPMKASGVAWIKDIPENWKMTKLGFVSRIGNGSTPSRASTSFWKGGTIPWLNSSKVNDGVITEAEQFVTTKAVQHCHLPMVKNGSLVIAITGEGKTRGMAALCQIDTTINQHLAYITVNKAKMNPLFVLAFLRGMYSQIRGDSSGLGSTKGAITCGDLKKYPIPIPPLDSQAVIVRYIENETAKLECATNILVQQIEKLKEYKATLISSAVTGKIKVV